MTVQFSRYRDTYAAVDDAHQDGRTHPHERHRRIANAGSDHQLADPIGESGGTCRSDDADGRFRSRNSYVARPVGDPELRLNVIGMSTTEGRAGKGRTCLLH
jgi:hypothetical protein